MLNWHLNHIVLLRFKFSFDLLIEPLIIKWKMINYKTGTENPIFSFNYFLKYIAISSASSYAPHNLLI